MLIRNNSIVSACLVILCIITTWHWGQAAIIYGKAHMAKWLIANAWESTLAQQTNIKPWPWADTWPVAKISFPNKETFYILAGSTGNSLAFGPGHISNTALPGTPGASVIGGHRDTHFALLEHISPEQTINIQNQQGQWQKYTINKTWVANSNTEPLLINDKENSIHMITCYPFRTLQARGPERFIAYATKTEKITLGKSD